jgi:membrane-associated phospholipid phosphatase
MILLQSQDELPFAEKLLHADYWLMVKINRDWQVSFFDNTALFLRESLTWLPLYVFLLLFVLINFGKKGFWWVISVLAMAGISDIISSHIIKEIFDRPRPCRDEVMASQIRFLAKTCGMNGSFTSSHATNHFALATFIYFTLRFLNPWWAVFFLWAALISYVQVYVGVHYPSDVLGGAALGFLVGFVTARFFNHKIGLV